MAVTQQSSDLDKIEKLLFDRKAIYERAFAETAKVLGQLGLKGLEGVTDLAGAIMESGLQQLNYYESEVVDKFGDISTQQETFGKSLAKLNYERIQQLRDDFLQMEEGGVKLMDVFENYGDAAEHAFEIIGSLPGSAAQFTKELEKQNLTVIQLLSKAAGLAGEQTAAIMKIAKARGEDSKQMLSDIGTFSKVLADKYALDMKDVARTTVEITQDTSRFGKVAVEAATAAAAKFESLGVSVSDVADSIGSTFGSFSGAADAAAKLSQVFGVNIDAMQMMVDVNSGPEGMLSALDNIRESLIGAGVDASELSAPLRRLIKDMTGVRDDATIESLFDPDRISADTEDILETAKKAAEAQKEPTEAIKFLDNDIAKVHRSIEEVNTLLRQQTFARLGKEATGAARSFASLSSQTTSATDALNQYLVQSKQLGVGKTLDTALKSAATAAEVGAAGAGALEKTIENTAASEGLDISAAKPPNYAERQRTGRGVFEDPFYQSLTGYVPPKVAIQQAELSKSIQELQRLGLKAAAELTKDDKKVDEETEQALKAAKDQFLAAAKALEIPVDMVNSVLGEEPKAAEKKGSTAPPLDIGGTAAARAAGTFVGAPPEAVTPPASAMTPVAAPPAVGATPAAAAAPAATAPTATASAAAPASAPASAPAPGVGSRATGSVGSLIDGTTIGKYVAEALAAAPINLKLNVSLDAAAVAKTMIEAGYVISTA